MSLIKNSWPAYVAAINIYSPYSVSARILVKTHEHHNCLHVQLHTWTHSENSQWNGKIEPPSLQKCKLRWTVKPECALPSPLIVGINAKNSRMMRGGFRMCKCIFLTFDQLWAGLPVLIEVAMLYIQRMVPILMILQPFGTPNMYICSYSKHAWFDQSDSSHKRWAYCT